MFFLQNFNENWLLILSNLSNDERIAKLAYFFADFPIFFIPIFLVWFWLYWSVKKNSLKKIDLIFIFYWVLIWISISLLIQHFVHFDRPETHIKNIWKLLLKHIPDASFPSDHATVSFAFLSWLFLANYKKIALFFLPFVILMNISRIIAWVHWPLDILVWCIIWIFSAFFTFYFIKKLEIIKKINILILKLTSYIKL